MHIMTPLSHPFDTQKTPQLPNSPAGKHQNFMVFNNVSIVQVIIMSLFSFIRWFYMSLDIFWMLLNTFGSNITFIRLNLRSLYSPFFSKLSM